MKANDCMAQALKTYEQRKGQYGDSYLRHGKVMQAIFPAGIKLESREDFNRFGVLNMIVSKLVRYTVNWKDPHIDSIHDMGVYCFIDEELAHVSSIQKHVEQSEFNEKERDSLHITAKKV